MFDLAIIGLGAWGRRLVRSVQGKSETVRFVRAVARTPSKAEAFAAEHGIGLGADYAAALADDAVDGVVVCGPAHVHFEHAMAAVAAAKPVLVIKPLAQRRADAEALYEAAAKKGVFVGLGYERCFLPAADALRRRVAAGEIGRIVHAEGNYCVGRYFGFARDNWKADAAVVPPGALADHMLYMMVELMGPVDEVYARGRHLATDLDAADTASVMLGFASGASGQLTAIGITAELARLHLFGTEGWAEMRGASQLEVKPMNGGAGVVEYPAFDALRGQLERFAAAATGEAAFPLSPAQAIASVAALEAMARSAETGGPVRL